MSDLPRKAAARTARLARLPLGYAGRSAVGLGRRLGGAPADAVMSDIQAKTAEQVFRTLGELKGGAMKFGQALSVFEAALPEEMAAPYREQLTRLQDSAPPMPTPRCAGSWPRTSARTGRSSWSGSTAARPRPPPSARSTAGAGTTAATSRSRCSTPARATPCARTCAIGRLGRSVAPVFPGVDIKPLVVEMQARAEEELDYELEAAAQRSFAAAYRDDPEIVVPDVVAVGPRVLVTEWLESPRSLASVIASGTQEERNHYGELFTRFLFSSPARVAMLHADPHPGNYRIMPTEDGSPGRIGVLDFGAVARLPESGLPEAMGRLVRLAGLGDADALLTGLRGEGFVKDRTQIDAQQVMDYLSPLVEPSRRAEFHFTREWMRGQFQRINDPREPAYTVAIKLNLPPSYLLIHRSWIGGIGILAQLEARAHFRAILEEHLPGFAGPAA